MVYPCTYYRGARHVVIKYHTFVSLVLNRSDFNILITLHCLESGCDTNFIEELKFINILEIKVFSPPLS
jgi:hypothetical protein